jgi:hypothetical protein
MTRTWRYGTARLLLANLAIAMAGGCIASNVLAHEQRMVAAPVADLQFSPSHQPMPAGLYESVEITGDVALALRKVYYVFETDGTYTAAALVEAEGRSAFQTLNGTWALTADGLVLDEAAPVHLELAPDHVRIAAPNGTLVLHREDLR